MKKYELIQAKKAADRRRHKEEKNVGDGVKAPVKYGYRQLSIPGEVIDELRAVKEKYEKAWGGRMSYGDVISRLIAAARRYDPEVFTQAASHSHSDSEHSEHATEDSDFDIHKIEQALALEFEGEESPYARMK